MLKLSFDIATEMSSASLPVDVGLAALPDFVTLPGCVAVAGYDSPASTAFA